MSKQVKINIDEELDQSKARLVISSIVALMAGVFGTRNGYVDGETLSVGFKVIFSYLTFAGIWYLLVRKYPGSFGWRRNIGMFADLGIMSVFMRLGGQHSSVFYPLFLWIIIGNGIRFGEKMMARGLIMGFFGFGWVLASNAYWKENVEAGLGLLAGVVILPIFFLGVLKRLKAVHELRVELARSRLADKAKDQFLAAMSHELRTPMNGVMGMAETLNTTPLSKEQKGHVEVITRSVESLLNVINDILDYSKITAQSLTLESIPFDLHQTVGDVVHLMENAASEKGVDLGMEFPEGAHRYYLGDPTRVRQIVFNLVGNAVKFTEMGAISVQVRLVEEVTGPNIELRVKDTGVGIPADRLEAIFDHFEQADNSTTREHGGTGLGLAISKQLAELMGGQITVQSVVGAGSTFTVRIALTQCAKPRTEDKPESDEIPDLGLSALIVEDNKFNQIVIQNILKRIGVTSKLAENGQEALEVLDSDSFDVVFMDVRMPVMNGYDATRAIRNRQDEKGLIPILALTGEATKADIKLCLESGMDRHLAKPIRLQKIVSALREVPGIAAARKNQLVSS